METLQIRNSTAEFLIFTNQNRETAVSIEAKYDLLKDMDSKLNRIIYRENIQKKLLEQFYANMVFKKNYDVKTDESLIKFYQDNDYYSNKIMD